jgi:hypothetical protein
MDAGLRPVVRVGGPGSIRAGRTTEAQVGRDLNDNDGWSVPVSHPELDLVRAAFDAFGRRDLDHLAHLV